MKQCCINVSSIKFRMLEHIIKETVLHFAYYGFKFKFHFYRLKVDSGISLEHLFTLCGFL